MKVVQIDGLDTEPFQGLFDRRPDIFGFAIRFAGSYPEFSCQENLVPISSTFEPKILLTG